MQGASHKLQSSFSIAEVCFQGTPGTACSFGCFQCDFCPALSAWNRAPGYSFGERRALCLFVLQNLHLMSQSPVKVLSPQQPFPGENGSNPASTANQDEVGFCCLTWDNSGQSWANSPFSLSLLGFDIWACLGSELTFYPSLRTYWNVSTISRSEQRVQIPVWLKGGCSKSVLSDEVPGAPGTSLCKLCMLMVFKMLKALF